jgi:hypothetical protein
MHSSTKTGPSGKQERHGKAVQFGELILQFTSTFNLAWSDAGSGADEDGSFYHPVAPEGFHVLGSIGIRKAASAFDPNGRVAALCVKAAHPDSAKPALMPPTGYQWIWDDKGSGADRDGSCWRPIAPPGYAALGDVFVEGYAAPSLSYVMCVATELVGEGQVGERVWSDGGSGASTDFCSWEVGTSQAYRDTSDGLFAVNSFTGSGLYDKPSTSVVANTLRLPLPSQEGGESIKPELTSRTRPADRTTPVVDRIVTVPFTGIVDGDKTFEWKMEHSPFYDVERSVFYDLQIFEDNTTSVDQVKSQAVSSGVTREDSETFSITTGISLSYESGVEAGGFSTKVTAQLSIELGYSSMSSVSVFESQENDATLTIPAKHAGALWTEANSIRVFRADSTPVGPSLAFDAGNTAYLSSQFPKPEAGAAVVRHGRMKRALGLAKGRRSSRRLD